jgi:hypothetical protein
MAEMQRQYDKVCARAAQFKDEESHLQDLERRLRESLAGSGVEQAPEFKKRR